MDVVSIIIPIYNAEKYLKYAIESCLNQTYNNIEILLIDDGSKDKSKEICQEYVLKDSRIKYYFQKNQGVLLHGIMAYRNRMENGSVF